MRLWRLTRMGQTALDGEGASTYGGRYSPPADAPDDYVLGWTEIDAAPERIPDAEGDDTIRRCVTDWLLERRSLLAAVRSQVLPEADVVLMNPLHPDAVRVHPLVTRPFSFADCLHSPPMLGRYSDANDAPA